MLLGFHNTINIHQAFTISNMHVHWHKVNGQLCIGFRFKSRLGHKMGLKWHGLDGGQQTLCTAALVKSRYNQTRVFFHHTFCLCTQLIIKHFIYFIIIGNALNNSNYAPKVDNQQHKHNIMLKPFKSTTDIDPNTTGLWIGKLYRGLSSNSGRIVTLLSPVSKQVIIIIVILIIVQPSPGLQLYFPGWIISSTHNWYCRSSGWADSPKGGC